MALTIENINFKDTLFEKLKETLPSLTIDESISNNEEICLRVQIEEKDGQPFLDYFSRISNTEWINYTPPKKYSST